MQPSDPASPPLAAPPPTPAPAAKPRNRRLRLWLAMAGGVAVLLCAGAVGVFVSLYDDATEIKRSAPDAVVDNFLGAYLVNRNDKDADLYVCKSGADFARFAEYRTTMTTVERDKSVSVRVSWGSLTVAKTGATGTVTTDLTQTASDGARLTTTWSFAMVDQDGWRVCGASEVG